MTCVLSSGRGAGYSLTNANVRGVHQLTTVETVAAYQPSQLPALRTLAGRLGLPEDLWSHLPPDEEETRLREYGDSVLRELPKRSMTLDRYLEVLVIGRAARPV